MNLKDVQAWIKQIEKRYCRALPSRPIPAGRYLVHNQVRPAATLGMNGFARCAGGGPERENPQDPLGESHGFARLLLSC
jgi:hypothetical protein